jgi:hypothetical protein
LTLDIFLLRKVYVVYADWGRGQVSLRVTNVTWADWVIGFYSPFLNHFWVSSGFFYNLCKAMPESLSVANTAVSSANVAVVDSVEVGRSAVCSRYNNGPRTLPWHTSALTEEGPVYTISAYTLCR